MIIFFVPEYYLAKPFIQKYKLKKKMDENVFEIFTNAYLFDKNKGRTEQTIELVVTQKGQVRSSMAIGYCLSRQKVSEQDLFVCVSDNDSNVYDSGDDVFDFKNALKSSIEPGEEPGSTLFQNVVLYYELYNKNSGRYYYPDMIANNRFNEKSTDSEELCALYEALSCFCMQHQFVFVGIKKEVNDTELDKLCDFFENYYLKLNEKRVFHHIYIEKKLLTDNYLYNGNHLFHEKDSVTEKLINNEQNSMEEFLSGLPKGKILLCNHYKDLFNRKNQCAVLQKKSPALIVAKKEGTLIYKGSQECQSFGNDNFYYTSCMMNCLFDCEYCYLQGMYPSANVVLFYNIEDIFKELKELLIKHPVYLCVSYDTDLIALENITGYCKKWIDFAADNKDLTVEIRTKAVVSQSLIEHCKLKQCKNVIFAFTLTPEKVQMLYEHNTMSIQKRIDSINNVINSNINVRICFDPLIYSDDYKLQYRKLIDDVFSIIPAMKIYDVSFGEFRVPCEYLKKMRKVRKDSEILAYPFETQDKSSCYGSKGREMADYVEDCLLKHVPRQKLFRWESKE